MQNNCHLTRITRQSVSLLARHTPIVLLLDWHYILSLERSRLSGNSAIVETEDIIEHVERAVFGDEGEGLGELERVCAVVDGEGAGDEDDERVAIACGLGVARLNLVLHFLEGQALWEQKPGGRATDRKRIVSRGGRGGREGRDRRRRWRFEVSVRGSSERDGMGFLG